MKSIPRGFTLIELMVVVAIIGILVSIALPSYQAYLYRDRAADVVLVLDKIHTVLAAFQAEKGVISDKYCVESNPPSASAALTYYHGSFNNHDKGEIAGLARNELKLSTLGVDIHVRSCGTYMGPGQYSVFIVPLNTSDIQARQLALAVQHAMQKIAYKTLSTSTGTVMLYLQI